MITIISLQKRKFPVGQVLATPGAIQACGQELLAKCFGRHVQADWGIVCQEDAMTNDDALKHGNRILSAYAIDEEKPSKGWGENTVWIITEADRSATTILLPREY